MYCPSCGSEERQLSQFCRACGTDLRIVRSSLENPDVITQSAISAREHIGLALADKIRQMKTAKDLARITEEVLPGVEKFLESPEEKRLRRIRSGVITAAVGLGLMLVFLITFRRGGGFPFVPGAVVTFLIGLGIVLNGLLFTVPRKKLPGDSADALSQDLLDSGAVNRSLYEAPAGRILTNELSPASEPQPVSVTEHTTHHLNTSKS